MTRTFKRHEDNPTPQGFGGWGQQLHYPIHALLEIYGRQSTKNQAENNRESYEAQTKDLFDRALQIGWKEENIIIYVENLKQDGRFRSASGRLRIDQREGLSALVERIEAGEAKAVMVYQEDRLFRDETGIQYNVFIDICRRNNCIIITPHYTYDFNNDRYAIRLFRQKMEQAADFYTDYSKRLLNLKARVSERGDYDGRAIPVGYTVDRNKTSATFRKYIPYEPHASVVRWLFRRYRELCGNLHALCRELSVMPSVFPPFEQGMDTARYTLKPSLSGYHLSRTGLKSILSNVAYIGWWVFQERVTQKENHEAIVDGDDFWYAFNRLCAVLPDGSLNPQFKHHSKQIHTDSYPSALLAQVLHAEEGQLYLSNKHASGPRYIAVDWRKRPPHVEYFYLIKTAFLDAIFVDRMLDIARNEYLGDEILAVIEQLRKRKQEPLVALDDQLAALVPEIQGLLASLRLPEDVLDEQSRQDVALRLKELRDMQTSLQAKKQAAAAEFAGQKDVEEYRDILNHLAEMWESLSDEKKLKVIELIVESVHVRQLAPHWFGMKIEWRGFYGRTDIGYLYRGDDTRGPLWSDDEYATLEELYPTAERSVLLETFSNRPWSGIKAAAQRKGIKRQVTGSYWLPDQLSLEDYMFMQAIHVSVGDIAEGRYVQWPDFYEEATDDRDESLSR